ncbi:uncharacterized protein LOC103710638 [Phoenix dactylifera]|uniref:Uncharacterized protein LOC103710638 n=1 Tax=Phoenix dactylifera TaxID=42345 RepID=A0A8B9A8C5_PHODC|nr:uncharacterized protein LOC103710638 [Phoenix dactylifera]
MSGSMKLSLKLLVDEEKNRVVFAESDKDFVDILLSFLTLPIGTIVRLLGKKSSLGAMDCLYKSVENLDARYFQAAACKTMLLRPNNPSRVQCEGLALRVDDSEPLVYYKCPRKRYNCGFSSVPGARCPCGQVMEVPFVAMNLDGAEGSDGVFVRGGTSFIVSDDLSVKPVSMGASLALIQKLGIEDGSVLAKRNVELGAEEVLSLLKRSLVSKRPLTDLFLQEPDMIDDAENSLKSIMEVIIQTRVKYRSTATDSKRIDVKLFLSKESDKVVYAEAREDLVDQLFSFLTFPLGSILKLLDKHSSLGCIDNLYESVELLSNSYNYMKFKECSDMLLAPKLAPYFGCDNQLLDIGEMCPQTTKVCHKSCFGLPSATITCLHGVETKCSYEMNPKFQTSGTGTGGGFAKEMMTFMVTDEMEVTPLSPISAVSIINKLMVPINSLEEAQASLGEAEVLNLLRACLTSSTVLSDVFSPNLLTLLHERWCGQHPSKSLL